MATKASMHFTPNMGVAVGGVVVRSASVSSRWHLAVAVAATRIRRTGDKQYHVVRVALNVALSVGGCTGGGAPRKLREQS